MNHSLHSVVIYKKLNLILALYCPLTKSWHVLGPWWSQNLVKVTHFFNCPWSFQHAPLVALALTVSKYRSRWPILQTCPVSSQDAAWVDDLIILAFIFQELSFMTPRCTLDEDLLHLGWTFYRDNKAICEIFVTPLSSKLGQYDPFFKCALHLPKMQLEDLMFLTLICQEIWLQAIFDLFMTPKLGQGDPFCMLVLYCPKTSLG